MPHHTTIPLVLTPAAVAAATAGDDLEESKLAEEASQPPIKRPADGALLYSFSHFMTLIRAHPLAALPLFGAQDQVLMSSHCAITIFPSKTRSSLYHLSMVFICSFELQGSCLNLNLNPYM